MGNLEFQRFALTKQPQPEPMDVDLQHNNLSTTADMIDILSQLSDQLNTASYAEPTLQKNAVPPPSPPAYSNDVPTEAEDEVEGAPAEAEEGASDVALPLQHSN